MEVTELRTRGDNPAELRKKETLLQLVADQLAAYAQFFSFGTNDLTQMTFGFSRDDAGKFRVPIARLAAAQATLLNAAERDK